MDSEFGSAASGMTGFHVVQNSATGSAYYSTSLGRTSSEALGWNGSSGPSDTKLQPKALEVIARSSASMPSASAATAGDLQAGLSLSARDQDSSRMLMGLAFRTGSEVVAQERKKGAPLSAEEWQAFDDELAGLAARVEERLTKIVQELVHLLVPTACSRVAEASALTQGLVHPTKPWVPASEALRLGGRIHASAPDPELLLGASCTDVLLKAEPSLDFPDKQSRIQKDGRSVGPLTTM